MPTPVALRLHLHVASEHAVALCDACATTLRTDHSMSPATTLSCHQKGTVGHVDYNVPSCERIRYPFTRCVACSIQWAMRYPRNRWGSSCRVPAPCTCSYPQKGHEGTTHSLIPSFRWRRYTSTMGVPSACIVDRGGCVTSLSSRLRSITSLEQVGQRMGCTRSLSGSADPSALYFPHSERMPSK